MTGFAKKLSELTEADRKDRSRKIDAASKRLQRGTLSHAEYTAFRKNLDVKFGIPDIHAKLPKHGDVYGKLTVVSFTKNRHAQTEANCVCECGKETSVNVAKLNSGYTRSCGCLRTEKRKSDFALRSVFYTYKSSATQRKINFYLNFDQFKTIVSNACCYCGDPGKPVKRSTATGSYVETISVSGIDRIDNSVGYTVENSVACCSRCNYAKGEMDLAEFVAWGLRFAGEHLTVEAVVYQRTAHANQYAKYRQVARQKQLEFSLSFNEFARITLMPCSYCSASPYRLWKSNSCAVTCNGIDRIDNEKGYTISNSTPCCPHCNYAKRSMPVVEFRSWASRLGINLKKQITSGLVFHAN